MASIPPPLRPPRSRERLLALLLAVALSAGVLSQFTPWRSTITDFPGDRGDSRFFVHAWGVHRSVNAGSLHTESEATYFEDTLYRSRAPVAGSSGSGGIGQGVDDDVPFYLRSVLPLHITALVALVAAAGFLAFEPRSLWVQRLATGAAALLAAGMGALLYGSSRLFSDRAITPPDVSLWVAVPAVALLASLAVALVAEQAAAPVSSPVP